MGQSIMNNRCAAGDDAAQVSAPVPVSASRQQMATLAVPLLFWEYADFL